MMRYTMAATALVLLAACGGAGVDMTPQVPTTPRPTTPRPTVPRVPTQAELQGDATALLNDIERLAELAPTTLRNMPTSGSSTFEGKAALGVIDGQRDFALIGDSTLRIDYATGRSTGQADNFRGAVDGDPFFAKGQIRYSGGSITRNAAGGSFVTDLDGDLDTGRGRIAVGGAADGQFLGNRTTGDVRTRAIGAFGVTPGASDDFDLVGVPERMTATLDGRAVDAALTFTGEN